MHSYKTMHNIMVIIISIIIIIVILNKVNPPPATQGAPMSQENISTISHLFSSF